jgi:hypothetical protein
VTLVDPHMGMVARTVRVIQNTARTFDLEQPRSRAKIHR